MSDDDRLVLEAARTLCKRRAEANECKRAWQAVAVVMGDCEGGYFESHHHVKCWQADISEDKYCRVCLAKAPLWREYHKKVDLAAGALRSLMRRCRQ